MPTVIAKRLAAPLAGGSANASVKLHLFCCGEMLAPPGYLHREDGLKGKARGLGVGVAKSDQIWMPLPVFLVEHPTAGWILIDTGAPAAAAHDAKAAFGRLGAAIYNIRVEPEEVITARLKERGIKPGAIKTVVMTHLHLDHAGALSDFVNAKVVTTEREWESANRPAGFKRGYFKKQFDHALDFRLVDYEASSVRSFASFGRSFDLFGDGSIVLVSTPGHSAGHQSVILKLADREVLVCGDAAFTWRAINEGALPLLTEDEHNFKRSLREIRAYRQMTPSALVVPGHDAENWKQLAAVYE